MSSFQVNLLRWGSSFFILLFLFGSFRVFRWARSLNIILTDILAPSYGQTRKLPLTQTKQTWDLWPTLHRKQWVLVFVGIFLLNYGSAALTNYAVKGLDLFLYQTLISVGPLYALPLVWLMKGESISCTSIFGAILACSGLGLLCLKYLQ